jgi:hypothetical protein
MAKAGYSLTEAQEELGHSHATMTALYTHLFPNDADAWTRASGGSTAFYSHSSRKPPESGASR